MEVFRKHTHEAPFPLAQGRRREAWCWSWMSGSPACRRPGKSLHGGGRTSLGSRSQWCCPLLGPWCRLWTEPCCGLANAIPSHAHSSALGQGALLSSLSGRVCLLPLARYVISGVCQCGTRLNCLGLLAVYRCIPDYPQLGGSKQHTCIIPPPPVRCLGIT